MRSGRIISIVTHNLNDLGSARDCVACIFGLVAANKTLRAAFLGRARPIPSIFSLKSPNENASISGGRRRLCGRGGMCNRIAGETFRSSDRH